MQWSVASARKLLFFFLSPVFLKRHLMMKSYYVEDVRCEMIIDPDAFCALLGLFVRLTRYYLLRFYK